MKKTNKKIVYIPTDDSPDILDADILSFLCQSIHQYIKDTERTID